VTIWLPTFFPLVYDIIYGISQLFLVDVFLRVSSCSFKKNNHEILCICGAIQAFQFFVSRKCLTLYGTSQLLSLVQSLKTYIDRTTTLSNIDQSFRFFYPTKLDLTLYTLYFLR
jgi:hypothetical protein